MTVYDIFPEIQKNPVFWNVPSETVNQYISPDTFRIAEFLPNHLIYSSEAKHALVGIVIEGIAKVHTAAIGTSDHTLLKTLSVGDMFGIANLYAEQELFPSRIVSAEYCKILFIDGNAFKQFIEHDSSALRNYLTLQSKKIVYLNRKIVTYTAGSSEKRLAVFLLEHEVAKAVTLPCSMSELAKLLGIGRASLYRALDTLTEYGWIEKQDKQLKILDKESMANFI